MKTFYRWTDAVLYLKNLIMQSAPLAGKGIVVENTPRGRRISCTAVGAPGSSTAEYAGPFKLIAASSTLKVINGANEALTYCGGIIMPTPIYPDVFTAAPAGDAGVVYVRIFYTTDEDGEFAEYDAELAVAEELPDEYDSDADQWSKIVEIGTYAVNSGGGLTVTQSWTGGNITMLERWI
jgi:hypothetical protein